MNYMGAEFVDLHGALRSEGCISDPKSESEECITHKAQGVLLTRIQTACLKYRYNITAGYFCLLRPNI